jgi:phospho-N-acetylmuramoyl-pentapeptide-transferase
MLYTAGDAPNARGRALRMNEAFIVAGLTLLVTAALEPLNLHLLRRFNFGVRHTLREDIDNRTFVALHGRKAGTPDAGGALSVAMALAALLALGEPETRAAAAALGSFGLIGLVDDVTKVRRRRRGHGGDLGALPKLVMETGAGAFTGWAVHGAGIRELALPFGGELSLGLWVIPLTALATIALSNAVNITDGLDGLAGTLLLLALGALALASGLTEKEQAAAVALIAVAALIPFLYLNLYPARMIMGDGCALGMGALLGVTGILADQVVLLAFVSLVFVIEAASSFVQIVALRLGRRVFAIAPLHHHLEAIGWPEPRVTRVLWAAGAMATALGLGVSAALGYV